MNPEKVETKDTEDEGLLSFRDVTTTTKLIQDQTSMDLPLYYPLGNFTPQQVLKRPYLAATVIWNSAFDQFVLDWPSTAIMNNYSEFLNQFAYLRSGLRVHIRFNSTIFHQGSMMVGWLPYVDRTHYNTADKVQVSMMNAVVISASQQTQLDYDMPYRSPHPSFPIKTVYGPSDKVVGRLFMKTLTPFRAPTGATGQLIVQVYVSMLDPVAYGFVGDTAQSSTEFQIKKEEEKKLPSVGVKTLVEGASAVVRTMPYVGQYYGPMADVLNASTLSKPTQKTATKYVTTRYHPYINQCDSISTAALICPQTDGRLSHYSYPGDNANMTISQLAMKPGLVKISSYFATLQYISVPTNPAYFIPGMSASTMDYLSVVTNSFLYWRGSIRYAFYFSCNSLTSSRVALQYRTSGNANLADGNIVTQLLDIKGDTWHYITIPYISSEYWQITNPTTENELSLITMQAVDLAVSDASLTHTVDVAMFRSAGPDFQVAMPRELDRAQATHLIKDFQEKQFVPFQVRCEDLCGDPHEPQIGVEYGRCNPEKMYRIIDLLRLPSEYNAGEHPEPQICTTNPGDLRTPFRVYSSMFAFWRGSIRMGEVMPPWYSLRGTAALEYGAFPLAPYTNTNLEYTDLYLEVPYYETKPYLPTKALNPGITTSAQPFQAISTGYRGIVSAGDDFQMFHLIPPVVPQYVLPPEVIPIAKGKRQPVP